MREIKKIIIHCSDSEFGDAALIDRCHKERGWKGIGYHYVILNGCRNSNSPSSPFGKGGIKKEYKKEDDGLLEIGRPVEVVGAHCEGQNQDSIGICLIGKEHFSARQLYVVLPNLLRDLFFGYGIVSGQVYGHYEFNPQKTCPNIDMAILKQYINKLFQTK
ncbi:MAG: N-acetylmuramoyl-L-alanine amidase [Nitrospinae bacterium]|nr:N-acetylmuramoyl-L-alanine amidase [Nitrospinota bacterium]